MILRWSTFAILYTWLHSSLAGVRWMTSRSQYTIGYGKNAVMKCSYDTGEFAAFTDNLGQVIATQGRYTVSDESPGIKQLEISNLQDTDYGNYTCANSLGEKATILLAIGATISDAVTPQYLVIGTVGIIHAAVHGMPRPDIHWTYAGRKIAMLTSSGKLTLSGIATPGMYDIEPGGSLKIFNVTLATAGRYSIFEEDLNTGAKTEEIIDVEAGAKPQISKKPDESYSLFIGDRITLPCEWSVPPTDLTWTFTNTNGSVNILSGVDRAKGLTIESAQKTDVGTYVCSGSSKFGRDATQTKIVSVVKLVKPQILSDVEADITRLVGQSLALNCTAVGEPGLKVKWEKVEATYRKVLMDGPQPSAILTLSQLKESDSGTFVCSATVDAKNPDGTHMNASRSTTLSVKVPPVVVDSPSNMATALGKVIELICEATGSPVPDLAFRRGHTLLGEPTVTTSGNSVRAVLQLSVTKDDFTTLTCNASSQYGTDAKYFTLTEVVKPASPENLSGRSGLDYIELTWSVPPGPVDGYWLSINSSAFSSIQEEESDDNSFLYKGLQRNTEYVFTVAAENIAGRSELSLPFSIRTKDITVPDKPSSLKADVSGITVTLSWNKPENTKDDPLQFTVKLCEVIVNETGLCTTHKPTSSTSYELASLKENTEYAYEVQATNQGVLGGTTRGSFKTQAKPAPTPLPGKGKLGSGAVAGIIIAIIVIILVVVDLFCCFFNNCGFTHCCFETFCAAKGKGKYTPADAPEEARELKEAKSESDAV